MAVKIKFVGPDNRLPFRDPLYGTNLVWVSKQEEHLVADEVAPRLLKHPDVWASAGQVADKTAAAIGLEVSTPKKVETEEEPERPPLVQLDAMDRPALIEYAQRHFNTQPKGNVYQVRAAIRVMMNDVRHQ